MYPWTDRGRRCIRTSSQESARQAETRDRSTTRHPPQERCVLCRRAGTKVDIEDRPVLWILSMTADREQTMPLLKFSMTSAILATISAGVGTGFAAWPTTMAA